MNQTTVPPSNEETGMVALATFGDAPAVIDKKGSLYRIDDWDSIRGFIETSRQPYRFYAQSYIRGLVGDYYLGGRESDVDLLGKWADDPTDSNYDRIKDKYKEYKKYVTDYEKLKKEFVLELTRTFSITTGRYENGSILVDESSPQYAVLEQTIHPKWDVLEAAEVKESNDILEENVVDAKEALEIVHSYRLQALRTRREATRLAKKVEQLPLSLFEKIFGRRKPKYATTKK